MTYSISTKKQTYTIFLFLLLSLPLSFALTLSDYVANLDTSFYDGTIDIISFKDKIIDTDSNNQNDTLIFNLTTDYATSDVFTATIFFEDENLPVLSDTKLISSSNPSFYMNISTFYLTEAKYSYYVRIYNQIGQIVYESKKQNTSSYNNFETGTNVISITDENINNNFIRINLNLDVKRNETVNISVILNYDDKTISGTKEVTLTAPTQLVSIDIDNETMKSTHYKGEFNITNIIIGDKIIETNYITSYYDYEDFAKTSYIENITSNYIDIDENDLIDYLIINFTINSKEASSYNIDYDLYDEYGNFVASISKNESLGTGAKIISTNITGQELYKTKINGPYLITTARLDKSNEPIDILYYPHLTDIIYYSDFERPPLPDLNIDIDVYYNGSINLIKAIVTNQGNVPAFNVFVDVFDNESYSDQKSYSVINPTESYIFNFSANNTKNNSVFIGIVDFDNLIEESNETNNIISNLLSINILLNQGWNLISAPLKNDMTVSDAFGDYLKLFTFDNINKKWIEVENDNKINATKGYWIKTDENTRNLMGAFENSLMNLYEGWNLIGYPSLSEQNIEFVFEDINESLINVLYYNNNSWLSYFPSKSSNTLEIMKPGHAYWVNVNESVSLEIS